MDNMPQQKRDVVLPHDHGQNLQGVFDAIPDRGEFDMAADAFSLVSDATRLSILWLLCRAELCVSNIAALIEMSPPAVSHHLRVLKQAGLVSSRRLGKETHYRLAQTPMARAVRQIVDDMFGVV